MPLGQPRLGERLADLHPQRLWPFDGLSLGRTPDRRLRCGLVVHQFDPERFGVRLEQPVQMDDEIAHMGIVDARLRLCLPGGLGGLVVGIDADDVERVEVAEFGAAELLQLAAENQMQKLFLPSSPDICNLVAARRLSTHYPESE